MVEGERLVEREREGMRSGEWLRERLVEGARMVEGES